MFAIITRTAKNQGTVTSVHETEGEMNDALDALEDAGVPARDLFFGEIGDNLRILDGEIVVGNLVTVRNY